MNFDNFDVIDNFEPLTESRESSEIEDDEQLSKRGVSFLLEEGQNDERRGLPDQTVYDSFYQPAVVHLLPDERRPSQSRSDESRRFRTLKDHSIRLDDSNVDHFADVSRVGWRSRVQYALNEYEEENARMKATKHEIQQDPNKLLTTTVATLILLAHNKNVPTNYFMFTEMYLKSIRNEYGDRPYNIRNFLKYMKHLKKTKIYDWGEMSHVEPPKRLLIAKINEDDVKEAVNRSITTNRTLNRSRIPVPKREKSIADQINEFRQISSKIITEQQQLDRKRPKLQRGKRVEYFSATSPVTSDMLLPAGFKKPEENFSPKITSTPKEDKKKSKLQRGRSAENFDAISPITSEVFKGSEEDISPKPTSTSKYSKKDNKKPKHQRGRKVEYFNPASPVTSDMFLPLGDQMITPKGSDENFAPRIVSTPKTRR